MWDNYTCLKTFIIFDAYIDYGRQISKEIISIFKTNEDYFCSATSDGIIVFELERNGIKDDYYRTNSHNINFNRNNSIRCIEKLNEIQIIIGYKNGSIEVKEFDFIRELKQKYCEELKNIGDILDDLQFEDIDTDIIIEKEDK